jgi:hypothetical protein
VTASPASNFSPGDLRVSDADRDWAVSELTEHFQAGRITTEELEERSGLALQARTGKELAALFADLPAASTSRTQPAVPADDPVPAGVRHLPPIVSAIAAFAVFVTLVVMASGASQHHYLAGLAPLLVMLLVVRLLARRGLRREHYHEHRHLHGEEHKQEHDRLR